MGGKETGEMGSPKSSRHSRRCRRRHHNADVVLVSSMSRTSSSSSSLLLFFFAAAAAIADAQQCGSQANDALCANNLCCSQFGFCGNTIEYCGAGCQSQCVLREPSLEGFGCPVTLPEPEPYTGGNCRAIQRSIRARVRSVERGAACSPRVNISECELYDIMGGRSRCPNCRYYYKHVLDAMANYDLNCPDRIAAFLATIRHETDGLRTLFQPADCGAGGIHLIPQNFPLFLSGRGALPALRRQFDRVFPRGFRVGGNATCARELLCASWIVQLPENAFETAGWWFRIGSRRALGAQGCRDLRRDADVGLGVPTNNDTRSGATGFYKISRCVFGSTPDAGLEQRVRYYEEARRVTDRLK